MWRARHEDGLLLHGPQVGQRADDCALLPGRRVRMYVRLSRRQEPRWLPCQRHLQRFGVLWQEEIGAQNGQRARYLCAKDGGALSTMELQRGSRRKSQIRHVINFTAVWTSWTLVGRVHGMLWLFTQCPRSLIRCENSTWTAIARTLRWANHTIRSESRTSSDISERSGESPSVSQESALRHCIWLRSICGEEIGKDINSEKTLRNYRRTTHPCVFHKNLNKRGSSCAEKWWHFHIHTC